MTADKFIEVYENNVSDIDTATMMEDYARMKSDWYRVNHISISTLIDSVLPENSVLFKDGHECWYFYYDDTAFDNNEDPIYSRELHESFADFIRRIVKSLITEERLTNETDPLVSIDLSVLRMEH